MTKSMRQSTIETLSLGTVLDIFKKGKLPVNTSDLVDQVFGDANNRGSIVISGANGIVGAGKAMQLGSRLLPYGVPIVALDFAGSPDGIGKQYPGLAKSFGPKTASKIMQNIIRINYDGKSLPAQLHDLKPRFLLEAIPEILDVKKAHYDVFKKSFPEIEIRSVTSGFPRSELGVGIAHPAYPHEINKVWEMVEPSPSAITQLFWSLGMIPIPVSDNWSFVLDVLFCGATLAGTRYHTATNMPFWKIDKFVRKFLGPNPFRAHDTIGAAGANFLTWSCLHHLQKEYGDLFQPSEALLEKKNSGQNWYPLDHFRPLVDWSLENEQEFKTHILGPLFQMTSMILSEKRAHLSFINSIGEVCAQFRKGILATIRTYGMEGVYKTVTDYHKIYPSAGISSNSSQTSSCWFPAVFEQMDTPEWQQLYVNAEHDGNVGVISIGRESYNKDLDAELNRAIDWLKTDGIERVIISSDFHLSTQMVGADTSDFYPALENSKAGFDIAHGWSQTARRLNDEFKVSVGYISGKRCLGGFLELLTHCHYLVSIEDASLGMPEVTLPVVPGMEGCHWLLRKASSQYWPQIIELLLTGKPVKAKNAINWLVDYAGPVNESLSMAWNIASEGNHQLSERKVNQEKLDIDMSSYSAINAPFEDGRKAIMECIKEATKVSLSESIVVQAKHSADFMTTSFCRKGKIGADYKKNMLV